MYLPSQRHAKQTLIFRTPWGISSYLVMCKVVQFSSCKAQVLMCIFRTGKKRKLAATEKNQEPLWSDSGSFLLFSGISQLSHLLNYIISTGRSCLNITTWCFRGRLRETKVVQSSPVSMFHFLIAPSLSYVCDLEPKVSIIWMLYLSSLIIHWYLSNTKLLKTHEAETPRVL